jgi:arylformamidase
VVLSTDWAKDFGLPPTSSRARPASAGSTTSGPPDSRPAVPYVKFTDEIEEGLSSQRHLHRISSPVLVAYGSLETPEFQR